MEQLNLTDSDKARLAEILRYAAHITNEQTRGQFKDDPDFKPQAFFVGYLQGLADIDIELIQPNSK